VSVRNGKSFRYRSPHRDDSAGRRTSRLGCLRRRQSQCMERYAGSFWGSIRRRSMDTAHFLSAGVVKFCPWLERHSEKLPPYCWSSKALDIRWGLVAVAVFIAVGGLLSAGRWRDDELEDYFNEHGKDFRQIFRPGSWSSWRASMVCQSRRPRFRWVRCSASDDDGQSERACRPRICCRGFDSALRCVIAGSAYWLVRGS